MWGLGEGIILSIFLFICFYQHCCPALHDGPYWPFTVLWPSTETYGCWPPVTRCFIEKPILGTEKGFSTPMKLLPYMNYWIIWECFLRETDIWWEEGESIWRLIPYERALAQESSRACVMKYTFPRQLYNVEKCLMLPCHVYILCKFQGQEPCLLNINSVTWHMIDAQSFSRAKQNILYKNVAFI